MRMQRGGIDAKPSPLALLFLYGAVLDQKLDWLESAIHAKRPERLPPIVILSTEGDI